MTLEESLKKNKNMRKKVYDEGLIFFDYETYLNQEKKHIPNLVCAYKICKSCLEFGEPQINCSLNCGSKIEFIDNNSFCKWLLSNEKYMMDVFYFNIF